MSDARHGRFEIDLDEIEKQLRMAADAAPAPKNDPLAELARIVGQEDPFGGLFGNKAATGKTTPGSPASDVAPQLRPSLDPSDEHLAPASDPAGGRYASDVDAVLHGEAASGTPNSQGEEFFDPITEAYGSLDNAIDNDRYEPLAPPRSRKGLVLVGMVVVAAVMGTAGVLAWRDSGIRLASSSGAPPVIKADGAPLKVAPENPGGMEIPDQNKQIYERGAQDGQTRVVDRQEQPVDVREAARALSGAPEATAGRSGATANGAGAGRAARPNAVAAVLGEPRRVRTVSVRPDGTLTGSTAPTTTDLVPTMVPSGSLPPPVPVATIPITAGGSAGNSVSTPASTPSSATSPAASASAGGSTPSATPRAVSILPPQRPKLDARSSSAAPDSGSIASETGALSAAPSRGQRVATMSSAAAPDEGQANPTPMRGGRYVVQLGIRTTEQEARAAFAQLASKHAADLGGRSPAITQADVGGKTVYRMRVGPLPRDEANTLCNSLKSAGGQCIVLQN